MSSYIYFEDDGIKYLESTKKEYVDLCLCFCGIEVCKSSHSFGPAIREHYIIHYILDGKGIYKVGDKVYNLEKNQGFLICPGDLTYYEADNDDPWTYIWVAFNGIKSEQYLKYANLSLEYLIFESYQKEYDVPIIAIDTTNMLETQIVHLLQEALNEFGIHEVKIEVPRYIAMLNQKHWLKQTLDEALKNSLVEIKKIKDVKHLTEGIESYDFVKRAYLKSVDTSHSSATIRIEERNGLYD